MTGRRRSSRIAPLVVVAFIAAACSEQADAPAASGASASAAPEVTTTPDDFTEVLTSDVVAAGEAPSTLVDGAISDDPADEAAAGSVAPTSLAEGDAAPVATAADGSTGETTAPVASTSDTTTTTTAAPAGNPANPEQDLALAAAFTVQLDADEVQELGEVFDTVCLGTELVVAFGGAEAADAQYGLNLTTVTADSDLFNDEPLTQPTAEAVLAAYGRCGDLDDFLLLLLDIGPEEAELGRCVADAMPAGVLEASLVEEFQRIFGDAIEVFDDAADDAFDLCLE